MSDLAYVLIPIGAFGLMLIAITIGIVASALMNYTKNCSPSNTVSRKRLTNVEKEGSQSGVSIKIGLKDLVSMTPEQKQSLFELLGKIKLQEKGDNKC